MKRRDLLKAVPLALGIEIFDGAKIGLVETGAASRSSDDAIQHHAQELLRLLRERFPDGSTITATITDAGGINGRALARVWKADDRMRDGGLWIEQHAGEVWL